MTTSILSKLTRANSVSVPRSNPLKPAQNRLEKRMSSEKVMRKITPVSTPAPSIEWKSKKGIKHSLSAKFISAAGSLIPFKSSQEKRITYLSVTGKGDTDQAFREYKLVESEYNSLKQSIALQGFELNRMAVRKLKKNPEQVSVNTSGRAEYKGVAAQWADAQAWSKARKDAQGE